jgi:hypothetical protein
MGYGLCRHCAAGRCSRLRHWHLRCRICRRYRIFWGPSCKTCHANARALVADLFTDLT